MLAEHKISPQLRIKLLQKFTNRVKADLSSGNGVALLLRYVCKSKWDFSDKLSA